LHRNISAHRVRRKKIKTLSYANRTSYPLSLLRSSSDQPLLRSDIRRISRNIVSRKRCTGGLALSIAMRILGARHYRASWWRLREPKRFNHFIYLFIYVFILTNWRYKLLVLTYCSIVYYFDTNELEIFVLYLCNFFFITF